MCDPHHRSPVEFRCLGARCAAAGVWRSSFRSSALKSAPSFFFPKPGMMMSNVMLMLQLQTQPLLAQPLPFLLPPSLNPSLPPRPELGALRQVHLLTRSHFSRDPLPARCRSQTAEGAEGGSVCLAGSWATSREAIETPQDTRPPADRTQTMMRAPGCGRLALPLLLLAAAALAEGDTKGLKEGETPGNFMEDEQWLSSISQYSGKIKHWNRFRDVSAQGGGGPGGLEQELRAGTSRLSQSDTLQPGTRSPCILEVRTTLKSHCGVSHPLWTRRCPGGARLSPRWGTKRGRVNVVPTATGPGLPALGKPLLDLPPAGGCRRLHIPGTAEGAGLGGAVGKEPKRRCAPGSHRGLWELGALLKLLVEGPGDPQRKR